MIENPEHIVQPPNEAAGCLPCFTCGGFRLPLHPCNFCASNKIIKDQLCAENKELREWIRNLAEQRDDLCLDVKLLFSRINALNHM